MTKFERTAAILAVAGLNLLLLTPGTLAATRTWSGAGANNNWSTTANWGGTAPVNSDSLVFNGTARQSNTNDITSLSLNAVTFSNGGFVLDGNALTLAGTTTAFFTNATGLNTVACSLTTTAPGGRYYFVAPNSELRLTGVITNTAASGTAVGWLNLTNGGTVRILNSARSTRGMDLFQGTVIVDGGFVDAINDGLRLKPPTGSTVAVVITNNGTLRIGGGGNFRMGHNGTGIGGIAGAGSLSVGTIDSGTLELYGANVSVLVGDQVAGATGVFNQNGGLVWGSAGSGNTVTIGGVANADGTYNLNGGILWIGQVKQGNTGATNAVFNFNGGTLRPNASSATFMQGLLTARVQSGGAMIDTTNFSITIAQSLVAGSPSGGLTKFGNGTLTLNGTNTYTGTTTVSAGNLTLSTAALAGHGTVVIADGATLGVADAGAGTMLATPSLTAGLTTGSSLTFNLTTNPAAALLYATNLTAGVPVTVNVFGSALTAGTFELAHFDAVTGLSQFQLAH